MFTAIKQWIQQHPGKFLSMVLPFLVAASTSIGITAKELAYAYLTGAEFGESQVALEQKKLWEANMGCLTTAEQKKIKNVHNAEISSRVCPSGDVLISAREPGKNPAYQWVSWKKLVNAEDTAVANFSFISAAHAEVQEPVSIVEQQQVWVRCVYRKDGWIIQVETDGQYCTSYVINPYNGMTVRKFYSCACG